MAREDIFNLYTVSNILLHGGALISDDAVENDNTPVYYSTSAETFQASYAQTGPITRSGANFTEFVSGQ